MRQTHDVPGSVGHAMSHLSTRLAVLLTSNYPAEAVVKTMMIEASPLFPGLTEQDLVTLIDCLVDRSLEHHFPGHTVGAACRYGRNCTVSTAPPGHARIRSRSLSSI